MILYRAKHHTWLLKMKMGLKMKNRSQRYDVNRLRPRHGHRYNERKICLSMMIICIKQHLSNIWSLIHKKIKGYLRYKTKTITFQMCHLRHRLIIFLFYRKVMFHSQDIHVFVFLTIPWFTKSVRSWWVLVHEAGCIFEYIFWTTTH